MRFSLVILWVFGICLACNALHAEVRPRFVALLENGERIEGKTLSDWYSATHNPGLNNRKLFDNGKQLVWLRDRHLYPAPAPKAYVEMHNGDRLPGNVTSFPRETRPDLAQELPYVAVRTVADTGKKGSSGKRRVDVRVYEKFIRRIVWTHRGSERYTPQVCYFRDGREVKFRAARFLESGAIVLLLESGRRTVFADEIAELHMPARDPWEVYCEELAGLGFDEKTRLMQFDATDGTIITSTKQRFDALSTGGSKSDNWWHALQPVWSPDMIWVHNATIWAHRSYLPQHFPLSRILPDVERKDSGLSRRGWYPRLNKSAQGDPLASAHEDAGGGFGVHGATELRFRLPTMARSFRCRLGLDQAAGDGGCVIGRVFIDQVSGKPAFQSPHIVGAGQVHGIHVPIPNDQKSHELILQIDEAHQGRPAGSDPLDIRDLANWFDPVVELDLNELRARVAKHRRGFVRAWSSWDLVTRGDGEFKLATVWDTHESGKEHHQLCVLAEKQNLSLRRKLKIGPRDEYLMVATSVFSGDNDRPHIEVRINGLPLAEMQTPLRHGGDKYPRPLAVSVKAYRGQTVDVELIHHAGKKEIPVWWRSIYLIDHPPGLFEIYDDEGRFQRVGGKESDAKAQVVTDTLHSGERAIRLNPGARFRIGWNGSMPIRENPGLGEYRYLMFAYRKYGKGRLCVEVEHPLSENYPVRFDAGEGPPSYEKAKRIWSGSLPEEWIVPGSIDLYTEMGRRPDASIDGLLLSSEAGGDVLFDRIYLASRPDAFYQIGHPVHEEYANPKMRSDKLAYVKSQMTNCVALVEVEGRLACGVVFDTAGWILAPGHIIGKPGVAAKVTLADGQVLPAKTYGIHRGCNVGILQLDQKKSTTQVLPPQPHGTEPRGQVWATGGFALAKPHSSQVQFELTPVLEQAGQFVRAQTGKAAFLPGSPLVNKDRAFIGMTLGRDAAGSTLYIHMKPVYEKHHEMRSGKVLGDWLPGSEPSLGLDFQGTTAKVRGIWKQSPAAGQNLKPGDVIVNVEQTEIHHVYDLSEALATKNVDDTVTVRVRREKAEHQVSIKLTRRRKFGW